LTGAIRSRACSSPHPTYRFAPLGDNLILASVSTKEEKVTELFDKYNLLSLPIIDRQPFECDHRR
jgi:hypothetical protein